MFLFKKKALNPTESVDFIQKQVYEYLKPLGFRKFGRTFCRFTDTDIAQVINFQVSRYTSVTHNRLWINLGIRVPECVEHTFEKEIPSKKYYHEYECNIRCRLGNLVDCKDTYYDLSKNIKRFAPDIIKRLDKYVIPVFSQLNNRDAILKKRHNFPEFDNMGRNLILLQEAMIYGRRNDIETASRLFNEYYSIRFEEEANQPEPEGVPLGHGYYKLPNGALYCKPTFSHVKYLHELADKLGIVLINRECH